MRNKSLVDDGQWDSTVYQPISNCNQQLAQNLISICLVLQVIDRFISNIISNTTLNAWGQRYYWPLVFLTAALIVIKEFLYPYFRLVDLLYIVIIGFCVIQFHNAQQSWLIGSFLIMFAARNLDYIKLIRIAFFTILFCTFFSIIGAAFHKFVPVEFIGFDNGNQFTDFFGMIYFSYISHVIMFLTITYCVIQSRKISIYEIIFLWLINLIFVLATQTYNPFLVATIFLVGLIICQHETWTILSRIMTYLVPAVSLIFLFFLILSMSSGSSLGYTLNDLTSGRIGLSLHAINTFGMHPFSNLFQVYAHGFANVIGATYSYVDSAYILYLLRFGVIFFAIWVTLEMLAIRRAREHNIVLAWAISATLIHAMFDPEIFWIEFNPLLITLGLAFVPEQRHHIKNESL